MNVPEPRPFWVVIAGVVAIVALAALLLTGLIPRHRQAKELEAHGITGKRWTSAAGRSWGGKPMGRGAIYLTLQNRIYRGEIVHKDQTYPGEHEAIIDPTLWDAVQTRLAENAVERGTGVRVKNTSLLTGLLSTARASA